MRSLLPILLLLIPIAAFGPRSSAQLNPRLQKFFEQNIGLTQDQIDDIRNGIPVVMVLPPVPRPRSFCLARFTFTPRLKAI